MENTNGNVVSADLDSLFLALSHETNIQTLLNTSAGIWEGYTVGEHTEMVISQLSKYCLGKEIPWPLKESLFSFEELKIMLLFHDLGKHDPTVESSKPVKEIQHQRTLKIFETYLPLLPFNDKQVRFIKTMLRNDNLGRFFLSVLPYKPPKEEKRALGQKLQDNLCSFEEYLQIVTNWTKTAAENMVSSEIFQEAVLSTAKHLHSSAQLVGIPPLCYLFYLTIYFQADSTAYTYDSHRNDSSPAAPSLDYIYKLDSSINNFSGHLFVYDSTKKRLLFSPPYEQAYSLLASQF